MLLAYHYHRAQLIKEVVWKTRAEGAGRKPAPKEIRDNLSKEEQELYKSYAANLHSYKSNFIGIKRTNYC